MEHGFFILEAILRSLILRIGCGLIDLHKKDEGEKKEREKKKKKMMITGLNQ